MTPTERFARYRRLHFTDAALGFSLDVSRLNIGEDDFATMEARMQAAFAAMDALEKGSVANRDENRRVGHYWLRDPERAPDAATREAIVSTVDKVRAFAEAVHASRVKPPRAPAFSEVLVIGIGGSALGPQLVADALGSPADRMSVQFFDNTDPDGIDRVLDALGDRIDRTLTVVVSKSGGTKETRNGMLEAKAAYERAGLSFAAHAVAVTGEGSELDRFAQEAGFVERFPMWDWVGGRTSELSAVGLLPAALQGFDVDALLAGAREMDALTRRPVTRDNPAALLALGWFSATEGKGLKDMVILPYKDRLALFSRYLQQLVMESIGKEYDRGGARVEQGIAVYGNKGSTDQHAYVQQLRDGLHNFFVTFIEVLADRSPARQMWVEPDVTSGDYLSGFLQGTRSALSDKGRESITITLDAVDPRRVAALIALYERAVGLYAELVDVNAYHQPGVEAGKKAAEAVLRLQGRVVAALREAGDAGLTVEGVAAAAQTEEIETVFLILRHLSHNPDRGIERTVTGGDVFTATYRYRP